MEDKLPEQTPQVDIPTAPESSSPQDPIAAFLTERLELVDTFLKDEDDPENIKRVRDIESSLADLMTHTEKREKFISFLRDYKKKTGKDAQIILIEDAKSEPIYWIDQQGDIRLNRDGIFITFKPFIQQNSGTYGTLTYEMLASDERDYVNDKTPGYNAMGQTTFFSIDQDGHDRLRLASLLSTPGRGREQTADSINQKILEGLKAMGQEIDEFKVTTPSFSNSPAANRPAGSVIPSGPQGEI